MRIVVFLMLRRLGHFIWIIFGWSLVEGYRSLRSLSKFLFVVVWPLIRRVITPPGLFLFITPCIWVLLLLWIMAFVRCAVSKLVSLVVLSRSLRCIWFVTSCWLETTLIIPRPRTVAVVLLVFEFEARARLLWEIIIFVLWIILVVLIMVVLASFVSIQIPALILGIFGVLLSSIGMIFGFHIT